MWLFFLTVIVGRQTFKIKPNECLIRRSASAYFQPSKGCMSRESTLKSSQVSDTQWWPACPPRVLWESSSARPWWSRWRGRSQGRLGKKKELKSCWSRRTLTVPQTRTRASPQFEEHSPGRQSQTFLTLQLLFYTALCHYQDWPWQSYQIKSA